jgi:cell division protein FtsW
MIFAQNDFSTAMFLIFVSGAMFFIAGVKIRYFLSSFVAVIPFILILIVSKEHRVKRLIAFIDPEKDPVGVGYQIIKAKAALISGGFWGNGLGNGVKKFGTLPEAHSDFIFAIVGEETGLIGVFIIIILFTVFAVRGYAVSRERGNDGDYFSAFLGFGITTSIFYQALMNMAVVSGVVPATGIPLPFFSHGGSSMLVTLLMCGMLLNISKNYQSKRETSNE